MKNYYAWIGLVWDNVPISVRWTKTLEIDNLMPSDDRILNLEMSQSQVYFDGRASQYLQM
jgi:hypothetical protein